MRRKKKNNNDKDLNVAKIKNMKKMKNLEND